MHKKVIIGSVVAAVVLIGGIAAATGNKGSATAADTTTSSSSASVAPTTTVDTAAVEASRQAQASAAAKAAADAETARQAEAARVAAEAAAAAEAAKQPSAGCTTYLTAVDEMISQGQYAFHKTSDAFAATEDFASNAVTLLDQSTYELKILSAKTQAATDAVDGCEDRPLVLRALPVATAGGKVMAQGSLVLSVITPGRETTTVDRFDDLVTDYEQAVATYRAAA